MVKEQLLQSYHHLGMLHISTTTVRRSRLYKKDKQHQWISSINASPTYKHHYNSSNLSNKQWSCNNIHLQSNNLRTRTPDMSCCLRNLGPHSPLVKVYPDVKQALYEPLCSIRAEPLREWRPGLFFDPDVNYSHGPQWHTKRQMKAIHNRDCLLTDLGRA
jgi:hypothetical protein